MKYDFDRIINRRGTNSLKWDVAENELPMWVADMDFETAPEIKKAIMARAAHGIFGYSVIPGQWQDSIIGWWQKRHNFIMEKEWLIFCTGVVPAISSIVRKLTTPGEKVLLQTPVYNIFFNSIVNNGRFVVESPLKITDDGYKIDFTDLEKKLSDPQVTLMLLCNPQNPGGIIWPKDDLQRIADLCQKYHVTVVSDEIHCDLTDPGYDYTPFASVSDIAKDISITCLSPSKTFNLAGLNTAVVSVPSEHLRHKVWRALNTDEVAESNAFAINATIAAFTHGAPWLDELRAYLAANKQFVADFLRENLPVLTSVTGKATYLCWLDARRVVGSGKSLTDFIRTRTGLYISDGVQYGKAGKGFLRMNVACPRKVLEDGLRRLKSGIEEYAKTVDC